jgi:glycine/D-amino acid oxidase-like deaminating enzyme
MPRLSRRSFVAGSAALLAAPALRAAEEIADVPVAIIGAGAAGIAAARRLSEAKVRFVLVEAAERIGGRCVTEAGFSAPFDRGAHLIHRPGDNPLLRLAGNGGLDIYPAPRAQKLRVPPRRARENELEEFLAALVRANRAIVDAGRLGTDRAAAVVLPGDLGGWRDSVEFVLGAYSTGKALSEISTADFARAPERTADAFCREGYGTLLARLAQGLPVQLSTPARRLDWGGALTIDTPKGTVRARAVIVTVSTAVLAGGAITFTGYRRITPMRWCRCRSASRSRSRWILPAIRSISIQTTWCSRSPVARAPRRCSPISAAAICRWSASAVASPATSGARAKTR